MHRISLRRLVWVAVMMMFVESGTGSPGQAADAGPTVAPYGSWRSPISARMLVEKSVWFGDMWLDGDVLYWVEVRPEEQGRYVVVRRTPDGKIQDVLPAPYSARTLAHEYGGGALLASDGTVYFTNYADQRIWRVAPGDAPQAITAEAPARFADLVHDRARNRLICVAEDHSREGQEAVNRLVAVDLNDGRLTTLVEGADFYSSPCLSPDGRQLAWLCWHHPNMPWDGTELFVASVDEAGALGTPRKVAGGDDESIYQPAWSPDGTLYFVSDRSNWWNLYRVAAGLPTEPRGAGSGDPRTTKVVPILPMAAEFGAPQWVFGTTTYGFEPDGQIVARYTERGEWRFVRIDPRSGGHEQIKLPYSMAMNIAVGAGRAYAAVAAPSEGDALVEFTVPAGGVTVLRRSSPVEPDPAFTSIPQAIEFPTDKGQTAHAFHYPPANRDFRGPAGAAPPLLVMVHGGPTSATAARYRLSTQYWTSRGFAVCDVNYGGSTGYGREYRNRLYDSWGLVDVADATNAALYLAGQGKADREKLLIRGGSAGGYTTLACLAFRDVFRAGASHYGISDLALLVRDTHKFESRYLDRIVGLYPQEEARYRERSPIFHLDRFNEPIILLQGLEDKVVPPNQAELILESLKRKGVPVAYVPFAGEQHGFRRAENIIRAQEAELYFYSRVLGFSLGEPIEPVEIFNLPAE
jgi:dipeptidyl aminopeptidase/acylaminoacyl peptidase